MLSRVPLRVMLASLRSSTATTIATATPAADKFTVGLSRIARCWRKSLIRNFPVEDFNQFLSYEGSQRRNLGSYGTKAKALTNQVKTTSDQYKVNPELVSRYVVRTARAEDCGEILRLIVGLAEWEGTADQVEITEEDLRRDGFGDESFYQCILLEACQDDGVSSIIGYIMFTRSYCVWKGRSVLWEDIFIRDDFREKGLGSVLFHEASRIAYLGGCKYIVGYVDFENEPAREWYKRCGYENITEKHGYNMIAMTRKSLHNYVENHRPIEKLGKSGVLVESTV
ncbi:thialysine N-epsilon-acetyltransferase-like [Diadema setosum]|uniref:thialysine N-epsilon-acetyltransferase-like n=1 Tax=Diadema setosum TaxID=31175 RepID=UPI003B3BCF78